VAIFNRAVRILSMVAMGIIVVMMLLTVAEVIMRYTLNRVIFGSMEITEFLMTALVLAMAWCALQGKHVKVELVITNFPQRAQSVIGSIAYVLSLGFCFLVAWQNAMQALSVQQTDQVTNALRLPLYPFYFLISFGFAILCLAIVILLVKTIIKAVEG
jgi:TRAP-type C4-dicarboxylate transport system permease small subunit